MKRTISLYLILLGILLGLGNAWASSATSNAQVKVGGFILEGPTSATSAATLHAGTFVLEGFLPATSSQIVKTGSFILEGPITANSMKHVKVGSFVLEGPPTAATVSQVNIGSFLLEGPITASSDKSIKIGAFILEGYKTATTLSNIHVGNFNLLGHASAPPAPTPMMGKSPPPKGHARLDNSIVTFKLLSMKKFSGTNPFGIKDINALDTATKIAQPEATPTPTPHPSVSPSVPELTEPPTIGRTVVPTSLDFSCIGKSDGQYCKDSNTQVFCYRDAIMNSENCPSGCNETTKACNTYKP